MCGGLRLAASRPARHIALVAAVVGRGDIVFRLGVGNSERLSSVQDVLEWGALYRHRHCSGCDVAFRVGLWRPMTAFDTYAIVARRAGSGVGHGVDRRVAPVSLERYQHYRLRRFPGVDGGARVGFLVTCGLFLCVVAFGVAAPGAAIFILASGLQTPDRCGVCGDPAALVANALYIFGLNPFPHLDLTPFALGATGLI